MQHIIPTQKQIDFQNWELGVFLHFGIRTFYEGFKDWDGQKMEPAQFNPSELDCNQWAETVKKAGFKYMVLTAKHHDGFANWPSKYTDFCVANSPWKDGQGDVVKEYTDACRKHGLKVGIYYSPADASCPVYDDPKAYDDYFINQISELLDGRYGEINMLWFDGCGSEDHEYDWNRIIGEIRRMQKNLLIFSMGDPDYRWVGNECGLAHNPMWNVVDAVDFSILTEVKEKLAGGKTWLPAECDFMIRDRNWFFGEKDEHTVKSVEELIGNYYYSVGRGCNMLLNIGPDRRGLLPDKDSATLISMGDEIKNRFSNPLIKLDEFTNEETNKWVWKNPNYEHKLDEVAGTTLFDHVILQEDISKGEHVKRFRISIDPYLHGKPITVYEGYNIGHKAICQFPLVRCKEIYIEVLENDGDVSLSNIEVFRSTC